MANRDNQGLCCALYTKINPIPQRYIAAVMACLGLANAYLMRQCLSLTITQLVLPRNYTKEQIKSQAVCTVKTDIYTASANKGTRDWNQTTQSLIFSSFYIGYLISHIPGGLLADNYGSKWVLAIGILSTSILTFLTPLAIENGGAYGLMTLRVLMGLGEGSTFPALSVLIADWVPSKERSFLGSVIFGGAPLGTILSNSITGWMLVNYEWQVVFRVWGIVGVLWFIFFIILCYSFPSIHPYIKEKEKHYLLKEIGDASVKRKTLPHAPYKKILASISMWSSISAQIGHDWAFYVIITYLPKYFNDVLQIHIEKNYILSTLPSLLMWICSLVSGIIADFLISNEEMKVTSVRKLMTGIAAFGPPIFLLAASYAGCDPSTVIIHFCICMGLMGAYYGGMSLTSIDMSPNYAGIVMALTNGMGSLAGLIAPATVGWLTRDTTLVEWRIVFWLVFFILFGSGLIYCKWAESEIQPWNEIEINRKNQSEDDVEHPV